MSLKTNSSFNKLQEMKKRMGKLCMKVSSGRFFFVYLFVYLFLKDSPMNYSSKGVELIEEMITNFMPMICEQTEENYQSIGVILICVFEIYFAEIKRLSHSKKNFSKTLQNLSKFYINYLIF